MSEGGNVNQATSGAHQAISASTCTQLKYNIRCKMCHTTRKQQKGNKKQLGITKPLGNKILHQRSVT